MTNGSSEVASNMMFGTEAILIGNSTDMIQHPNFYIASLNGISMKGILLWMDPGIFRQPPRRANTVVDTGTPISFIPEEAYNKVKTTLISMINLPRVAFGTADALCFAGGLSDIDPNVPEMTLHFEGLDVIIIPRSVFFVVPGRETFCLAMLPMEDTDEYSIFGALFQQNLNIGFDVDENKIFIAPMTCASII
jgi:Xylanase inhibitor C-terminal